MRQNNTPVRRQVDEVLTAQQLTLLKDIMLCRGWPLGFMITGFHEKIGMTKAESAAYYERQSRLQEESHAKFCQQQNENDEQSFAVLSPAQRETVTRIVGKADADQIAALRQQQTVTTWWAKPMPNRLQWLDTVISKPIQPPAMFPIRAYFNRICRRNSVNRGTTEDALHSSGRIRTRELYKLAKARSSGGVKQAAGNLVATNAAAEQGKPKKQGPVEITEQGWIKAEQPKSQQKAEELERQLRQQIKAVLTPEQSAKFKAFSLHKAIGRCLRAPWFLKDLNLTKEQQDKLARLREDRSYIWTDNASEMGRKLLDTLSPQRRQKLMEELDRRQWLNL